MMRHAWVHRVGIVTLVGVLVPSTDLVLMTDTVGAVPPTKSGRTPIQHWDRALSTDEVPL